MTADRINEAVNECLSRCYTAPNPLAALAEYLEQLRSTPRWTHAEVDLVETNSLRILRAILNADESD